MEPHPGVFMANVSEADWQPDPEVPGTEFFELVNEGNVVAGMTRMEAADGPLNWTPEQRETVHVVEGSVSIEIAGGATLELGAGDIASFPAGLEMVWTVTAPFKEFWVFG